MPETVISDFQSILEGRPVLLFDGVCVMCNHTVRFLLRNEPTGRLLCTPMEGPLGASLLAQYPQITAQRATGRVQDGSVVLLLDVLTPTERVLTRTAAAIAVMGLLRMPWPVAAKLLQIVPRPLRDFAYSLVARFRYRIRGRYTTCPIPTPAERSRIIGVEAA